MKLLIASANHGKILEISKAVAGLGYELLSTLDLDPAPPAPDEVFATFSENALLKARYYRDLSGHLSLADDSGLVVDALGGAPGVHSARFVPNATSAQLIEKLLGELASVKCDQRSARFVCAVAIVGPDIEQVFEGTCEGRITCEPRGTSGFGYDPVFLDDETGKTFAELTLEEKMARSHRSRALESARDFLRSLLT